MAPIRLVRCAAMVAALWTSVAGAAVEILPTGGRNIYRLVSAELDGRSDAREIVGSTYDNRVCAFDARGIRLWDAPTGGFVADPRGPPRWPPIPSARPAAALRLHA